MEDRAKLIGFNHVAIEVGNIEEALEFYGRLFEIELRGRGPRMAFIDAGDQFIALAEGGTAPPTNTGTSGWWWTTGGWSAGAQRDGGGDHAWRGLDFFDPWGNQWQVVDYSEIQFTKAPEILKGMGQEAEKSQRRSKNCAGKASEEAGPLAHREHGGRKIQSEPIIFREPAELGSGEGRLEDPAHAVTAPFERPAHETQEQMPVVGPHERRTPLGGDHQAGGDLGLRLEYIRR